MEPRSMKEGNTLTGWRMASPVYPTRRMPIECVGPPECGWHVFGRRRNADIGTGTYTIMTQIAAQWFGVLPEKGESEVSVGRYTAAGSACLRGDTAASTGSSVYLAS
ncbi:MAG TPA: hypothetical protein VHZ55_19460 [Bryobacteraceae bacterium]|nr:hypothetical protein [Bryobacteraceae bacterium]